SETSLAQWPEGACLPRCVFNSQLRVSLYVYGSAFHPRGGEPEPCKCLRLSQFFCFASGRGYRLFVESFREMCSHHSPNQRHHEQSNSNVIKPIRLLFPRPNHIYRWR